MKYTVKFSCGHEETIELFGKGTERERKIKYYEEYGECSTCYKSHKAEKLSQTHDVVEMHYGEYKKYYDDCKTVSESYNKDTKTIKVYVSKQDAAAVEVAKMTIDMESKGVTTADKEACEKYQSKAKELAEQAGISCKELASLARAIYIRIK